MRFPVVVLPVIFFFSVFSVAAQSGESWKIYKVQPGYSYAVNTKKMLHGKKKAGLENNVADFYLYKNGVLVKPPKNIHYDFFPAGCIGFKYDDTLLLNSGLGSAVGVGVGIKIFRHEFTSSLHANTNNQPIYKETRDDSVYLSSILAQPETQSLKLYKLPDFVADEVVVGEYRATYKKFYKRNDRSGDDPCRYTVRIVFKCRVTGGIDSMKNLTGSNNK